MKAGTWMPTAKDDPSRNAFEGDLAGTAERTLAEGKIENLRLEGGIFVEAVRATRMPMAVTDPTLPGNPIVFANQSFLRLSGYAMKEVLGQQPHFMNGPDTDPDDAARFEEALRADQDDIVETVQYRRDGTRFVASVLLSAFKDDKGRTVHHFLSWLDVTRRQNAENRLSLLQQAQSALRESEERQAFLLKLSDSLRSMQNAVEIQNAAMRYLAEQLNVARAGYYEVGADQDSFSLAARWDSDTPSLPDKLKMSDFGADVGEAYRAGRTLISRDIEQESPSATGREMYRSIGTRARIGVPLVKEGRLLTVVAVHSNRPRDWTSAEIQLVEAVAERTWDAVERARAEAALRQSEARLRGMLDGMGEGFGVIGPDFTILEHNREALRMDGRPAAEIVGRSHWEAFPGTEHSEVGLLLKKAMADRQPAFLEHRYWWEEGRSLWLDLRVYPMADGSLAAFWRDVTERKAAEEALRESEERFAQFATSTTDVLWIRDADTMALEYISPAFESVFGVTTDAVNGGIEPGAALVDPADRERVMEHLDAARRGEPQDYEFRIAHGSDGAARWIRDYCFPLIGETGRVRRIGGIARDVTKLKLAEEALRESETRLKAAFESVPAGLAVLDLNGRAVIANAEFRRFLPNGVVPSREGEHVDRWRGWSVDGRLLDPKEWPSARALRGERVVPGQQMLYIDDEGHRIWTNVATAPTLNGDGQVTGVVTVISDIDAMKRAQEALRASEHHAQLLLAELQHRVRNTLAVVRSIARRTAENSSTADDMLSHFQGRLDAFSRTQAALTRNTEGTVDLTSLIQDELVAHASREGEQVHIDGVALALQPREAERMSLAVHELMTNAVKHGALRNEEGEIRISWELSGKRGGDLLFNWAESGVELDTSQERREGFGMELLLRSLPHDLDGESSVDITPGGLHFRLRMKRRAN